MATSSTTRPDAVLLGGRVQVPNRFGLVGTSPPALALLDSLKSAAGSGTPVLVTGEAGAGKKAAARAIHAASGGGPGPVRVVSCAHVGPNALADLPPAGTVVLDGIAELHPEAQARLLAALDEDAMPQRLVATLQTGGENGLRADLLARIGRMRVHVPPLRERSTDVPLLVEHFLASFCNRRCGCIRGVTPEALSALSRDAWPGNVRELRAVVEKAVVSGRSAWIGVSDLPARLGGGTPSGAAEGGDLPTLAEVEEQLIRLALSRYEGNKARVARALGISRHRLYLRLRKMGVS